jgi:hypothetical protein
MLIEQDKRLGTRKCWGCGKPIETIPYVLLLGFEFINGEAKASRHIALHIHCANLVGAELAEDVGSYLKGEIIIWQRPKEEKEGTNGGEK